MKTILHITTRQAWEDAQRLGSYAPPSLTSEGFIHCSTVRQVIATANAFFRGRRDLVLLVIDEAATSSRVKYEPPADTGQADPSDLFPHHYGPLDLHAVLRVVDFPPNLDGTFSVPVRL
jgi:uncharacterized protein (DUF952 family)